MDKIRKPNLTAEREMREEHTVWQIVIVIAAVAAICYFCAPQIKALVRVSHQALVHIQK